MFDQEAEYAQTHDDLPAKVSFTVGGYENPDGFRRRLEQLAPDHRARMEAEPGDWAEDYVGDTERMVTTLRGRAYPSLEIEHEVLPGEYHETAVPTTSRVRCATSSTRLVNTRCSRDIPPHSGTSLRRCSMRSRMRARDCDTRRVDALPHRQRDRDVLRSPRGRPAAPTTPRWVGLDPREVDPALHAALPGDPPEQMGTGEPPISSTDRFTITRWPRTRSS